MNSTRSTYFITPKSNTSLTFRNAVLSLAREHAFARALVNSGRLSVAANLTQSRLNTPDTADFRGDMVPGAAMDDAPMQEEGQQFWLLDRMGRQFTALVYVIDPAALDATFEGNCKSLAKVGISVGAIIVYPKKGCRGKNVIVVMKMQCV